MTIKKNYFQLHFLLIFLSFSFLSCAVTIPAVDTTPPTIRLSVFGSSFNKKMENPPRELWEAEDGTAFVNLPVGTPVRFALLVQDQGGVGRATILIPDDIIVTVDESTTRRSVGIQNAFTKTGNRATPVNTIGINGTMTARRPNTAFSISVEADDFGGSSGRTNQRFMSVSVGS